MASTQAETGLLEPIRFEDVDFSGIATEMPVTFGSLLRDLRRSKDYTQRALANVVGIDFTYLSKLENDKQSLSLDVLEKIIQWLACSEQRDELYRLAGLIPDDLRVILVGSKYAPALIRAIDGLSDCEVRELTKMAQFLAKGE